MRQLYVIAAIFAINSIFSQVNVKNLQGQTVDLFEELDKIPRDKPILVFTWANEYCPPCEKILDALQKEYPELKKDYGLRILTINSDFYEDFPDHYAKNHQSSMGSFTNLTTFVKKYTTKKGWTFDHYIDDQAEFYNISEATGAPSAMVFYDKQLFFRNDGFVIPEHKKGANFNDPEIIQATVNAYFDVIASFTSIEQYFNAEWMYSVKEDAVYKRNIVKIGEFYEITDSWVTGEIQMRGLSLDVAGTKKYGLYKYYYQNGKLQSETNYRNDKIHGLRKEYNEKGDLIKSSNWADGVLDGAFKEVDEDGGVFEGNFTDEKYDGTWKGFYPNGKPKVENVWGNGLLMEIKFYNDPNGNPLDKGTLTNGSGTRKVYNNQGILIRIETYEAGKFISEYEVK
jgi:antitoxin component YwqK of YwqJK toxin-antitoxin module